MKWENCHEYFLSEQFKNNDPEVIHLLKELSSSIRNADRQHQRNTALKLIAIHKNKEIPRIVNCFSGGYQETQEYLNELDWIPRSVFCDVKDGKLSVITIR